MRHARVNVFIAYADFLLVILAFVIALVTEQQKMEGPKAEAEFLITASWDDHTDADVDLWGLPPRNGDGPERPVYYSNREVGALHLDRDSRGFLDNKIRNPDGTFTYLPNKEIMTIRGLIAGPYVFGLHMYAWKQPEPVNVTVHIEAIKIRPEVKIIFAGDFPMTAKNQALNVVAFTFNSDDTFKLDDIPLRPVSDIFYKRASPPVIPGSPLPGAPLAP